MIPGRPPCTLDVEVDDLAVLGHEPRRALGQGRRGVRHPIILGDACHAARPDSFESLGDRPTVHFELDGQCIDCPFLSLTSHDHAVIAVSCTISCIVGRNAWENPTLAPLRAVPARSPNWPR